MNIIKSNKYNQNEIIKPLLKNKIINLKNEEIANTNNNINVSNIEDLSINNQIILKNNNNNNNNKNNNNNNNNNKNTKKINRNKNNIIKKNTKNKRVNQIITIENINDLEYLNKLNRSDIPEFEYKKGKDDEPVKNLNEFVYKIEKYNETINRDLTEQEIKDINDEIDKIINL